MSLLEYSCRAYARARMFCFVVVTANGWATWQVGCYSKQSEYEHTRSLAMPDEEGNDARRQLREHACTLDARVAFSIARLATKVLQGLLLMGKCIRPNSPSSTDMIPSIWSPTRFYQSVRPEPRNSSVQGHLVLGPCISRVEGREPRYALPGSVDGWQFRASKMLESWLAPVLALESPLRFDWEQCRKSQQQDLSNTE